MARTKATKKNASKRDPQSAERNRRIMLASAIIIGAGAVFVGAAMGVAQLDQQASEFILPAANPSVVVDWPVDSTGTTWMPINERERIEQLLSRAVKGGTALSRAPLEEAGRALIATGWIDQMPTVRWTSHGQISIDARWRTPAAAVRVGDREIIIDWNQRVLPLDYALGVSNQIYFINADGPLPATGERWVGTDLEEGLALFHRLMQAHLLEQVAGFDLGKGAQSGTLRIITNRGASIIWGAGPGHQRPGEEPAGVKIDRLNALLERTGLIDGGAQLVDLRGANILLQRKEG